MQHLFSTAALVAIAAAPMVARADGSCVKDNWGNSYCEKVDAITYSNVGSQGSYNKVTQMTTGQPQDSACESSPFSFSGSMAPLDEEVSLHFRGPIQLKQVAVYTPESSGSSKAKRGDHVARHAHQRRHGHSHASRAKAEVDKRGETVTAVIDGKTQTFDNTWSDATAAPQADVGGAVDDAVSAVGDVTKNAVSGGSGDDSSDDSSDSPPSTSSPSSSGSSSSGSASTYGSSSSSGSGWTRQASYNADSGSSSGLVFLNNKGDPSLSGTWDSTFGNSLSYATSDGCNAAASAQTLADTQIPSTNEVIIMTDRECSGDSCGYTRPDTVAHHGFGGAQKAFFLEFQMPDDGTSSSSPWDATNMPAVWLLNAQVPRTLQYGAESCSCWASGCGEFDIFEVLYPGYDKAKSTMHGHVSGGDSSYFTRPTENTVKVAMIQNQDNIHIKILDDSTEFGDEISSSQMSQICDDSMDSQNGGVSLFNLATSGTTGSVGAS